jgi:bifunctional UDP-N-acetylglucosamine pyrophosphorylase/glucosamine-1-phosphate N-acetyltransferase
MGAAVTRFRHPDVAALVLAAGQGTRMNSDLPKVLHPMDGRPLLGWVLGALDDLGVGRTMVVIGHGRDQVQAAFPDSGIEWVVQSEQRGTGHAVMMAGPSLSEFDGTLLVVCGDTPLLRAPVLHDLIEGHRGAQAAGTVLSTRVPDPTGYGRILRNPDAGPDAITGIVEDRDATPAQRAIDEINSGNYAFDYRALEAVLGRLSSNNSQGEYYLTDTMRLLLESGHRAAVRCAPDYRTLLGINTPAQLAEAERIHRELEGAGTPGNGES